MSGGMESPPDDDERRARAALTRVAEPGEPAVAAAVRAHGAVEVWHALRRGRSIGAVSQRALPGLALRAQDCEPAADLEAAQRCGARLVCPGEPEWPAARLTWSPEGLLEAPPFALWVRGPHRLSAVVERSVAIVGARAASRYGESVALELAGSLATREVAVVSGAAYGIDSFAHRGALDGGGAPTVAVLACGVDVAYPRGNERLLTRIAEAGLVVSELPVGRHPTRRHFLTRNRLIAALSLGTVVVEAATRSGSLATLERARMLERHVMAVPGSVLSPMSAGCHEQIRNGATCVTRAEEVLELVGRMGTDAALPRPARASPRDGLSDQVRRVLDAVPARGAAGVGAIAREAGVTPLVVQQVLPPLQAHGLVDRTADGFRLTSLGASR